MGNVLSLADNNSVLYTHKSTPHRILVADDEATIRKILKLVLEQSGYQVVEAASGAEVLRTISRNSFDLILLDIVLPDINGLEVLRYMRKNFSDSELPVILVTGKDKSEDISTGLTLGANDYIAKPIDNKVMLARIQKQLLRKQMFDNLSNHNRNLQKKTIEEEGKLNRLRDHYEMILNCAGEGIFGVDINGKLTFLNPAAAAMIGHNPQEIIGKTPHDIMHHSHADGTPYPAEQCPILRAITDGRIHRVDNEVFWKKDGTSFPVEYVTTPIFDNHKKSCGAVVVYSDITVRKRIEETLFKNESRMAEAQRIGHVGNWEWDMKNRSGWWSEEMYRIFGVNTFTFKPRYHNFLQLVHPADRNDLKKIIETFDGTRSGFEHTCRILRPNGEYRHIEIVGQIKMDAAGRLLFLKGVCQDITVRRKAEESLRASEQKYRVLYDDNPSMYFTLDRTKKIRSVNRFGSEHLGYTNGELIGKEFIYLIHAEDRDTAKVYLDRCFANPDKLQQVEHRMIRKDGNVMWIRENSRVIKDNHGQDCLLTVADDISETKIMSEQLTHQASHDNLTDLVNRRGFEQQLHWLLNTTQVGKAEHVLCFLDFDNFKVINDTCGHSAGDMLLLQLGNLLREHVRKRDTLARLGGNEFAILMEHCTLESARNLAGNLLEKVRQFRFVWDNNIFSVGVSIGLADVSAVDDVSELLKMADTACYAAKGKGGNRIHVYRNDDKTISSLQQEVKWVSRINKALEENGFKLYAQTIAPLGASNTGKEHYELLVRMIDPEGNCILPGLFLPAAEHYKLASRLDRWVINTAFDWFVRYPQRLENLEFCSINLSGLSIGEREFLDFIIHRLGKSDIPPGKICFEITETAAISDMNSASQFIHTLRELGCKFALDDFGSGLSSFGYLKQLPVDILKIDGMFIRNIAENQIDFAMVKMINEIGQVMGMKTVAEFAENEAIIKKLETIGIDYAQGFGIGTPQPLAGNPVPD